MRFFRSISVVAAALALSFAPVYAAAQDAAQSFDLELNQAAETDAGSCRLTYVAANRSDMALDQAAFEVGVFDVNGSVTRLLVLEFGEMIAGKTKILQFELAGSPCASISRILVNDVAACTVVGMADQSAFCLNDMIASSRTAIQFGI